MRLEHWTVAIISAAAILLGVAVRIETQQVEARPPQSAASVAALATAQTWQPPELQKTWKLWTGNPETSFVKPEHCGQHKVGGKMIEICDISPALKQAMAVCDDTLPVLGWEQGDRVGCDIEIPPGRWLMKSEVRVCRGHRIHGHGSANWGSPTMIFVPKTVSAFRFAFFDECMGDAAGGGAQGATLERVAFRELTGIEVRTTPNYAIKIQAPGVNIRDVWARGFVWGIEIHGDVTNTPRTNANLWALERVQIDGAEGAGLYVHGGDSNGGLASLLDVHTACTRGSTWKAHSGGACAPILGADFLGSTYVASHASGSNDATTQENFANYVIAGASNKSTLIGPYSESDKVSPTLAPNSISIGGAGGGLGTYLGWSGGMRIVGPNASALVVRNEINPANRAEVRMGAASNLGGVALQIRAPSGDLVLRQPVNFVLDPELRRLRLNVAGISSGDALTIGMMPDAACGGYAGTRLPKLPICAGTGSKVVTSTVAP